MFSTQEAENIEYNICETMECIISHVTVSEHEGAKIFLAIPIVKNVLSSDNNVFILNAFKNLLRSNNACLLSSHPSTREPIKGFLELEFDELHKLHGVSIRLR